MRKLIWKLYNENRISEEIVHVLLDSIRRINGIYNRTRTYL